MSFAISSSIPCLGKANRYYERYSDSRGLSTKDKVILVVGAVFAGIGLGLLPVFPVAGGVCLIAAGVGILYVALAHFRSNSTPILKGLAKLEPAKQLAAGIEISQTLQQELEQVIPSIDAIQEDRRVGSLHYNRDETATFTLQTAPNLQFRITAPSSSGVNEFRFVQRYENMIHAQEICQSENYDALSVPSVKPIFLKVNGIGRVALVEKVVQRDVSAGANLERAVRQAVQFFLKTGGNTIHDPISLVPIDGGRLVLQNLHHLTQKRHPNPSTCESLQTKSVLEVGAGHCLLEALDKEDLIDIALDEFDRQRPMQTKSILDGSTEHSLFEAIDREDLIDMALDESHRQGPIQPTDIQRQVIHKRRILVEARKNRLQQIQAQVSAVPPPLARAPNLLRICPEDLGLDLALKDYAVMKSFGVHSDGVCRVITLGEVAQAIIDRINQKLQDNPDRADIEFTPQEMLIGETPPISPFLEKHYQYNTLRGLGYREWPDPNQEPPFWMTLVLQSLKNKGIVTDFEVPSLGGNPRLRINLDTLISKQ